MANSTAPAVAKGAKPKSSHKDDQKKRSSSHSTPAEAVKSAAKAQAKAARGPHKHTQKGTEDPKKQPEATATAAQLLAGLTSGNFPRGGGSALTAAEYHDTLQTARADAAEEAFQRGPVETPATTSRKRPHRRDTGDDGLVHDGRSRKRRPDAPNAGARIEHLNYKVRTSPVSIAI